VGPVDKRLGQIEFAALAKILGECTQHLHEHSLAHPLLHPAMAGLIRRIFAAWQRAPRRTAPQHPKNALED